MKRLSSLPRFTWLGSGSLGIHIQVVWLQGPPPLPHSTCCLSDSFPLTCWGLDSQGQEFQFYSLFMPKFLQIICLSPNEVSTLLPWHWRSASVWLRPTFPGLDPCLLPERSPSTSCSSTSSHLHASAWMPSCCLRRNFLISFRTCLTSPSWSSSSCA